MIVKTLLLGKNGGQISIEIAASESTVKVMVGDNAVYVNYFDLLNDLESLRIANETI